jgi:hypothetical protein
VGKAAVKPDLYMVVNQSEDRNQVLHLINKIKREQNKNRAKEDAVNDYPDLHLLTTS